MQYEQDYDEKLPPITAGGGWAMEVQPYIKSTQIFQCVDRYFDGFPHSNDPKAANFSDYFYNSRLEMRKANSLGDPTYLILLGEGNDGHDVTNARYAKNSIPFSWRTDQNSPSFRHEGAANYLFADGHVKKVKVKDIFTNWKAGVPCFQPQKPLAKK